MGLGDILGSISPAFGIASGNGIFGQAAKPMASSGMMGLGGLLGLFGNQQPSGASPADAQIPQHSNLQAILQALGVL